MKKILFFWFLLLVAPKLFSQNYPADSSGIFTGVPDSLPHFKNTIQDWYSFLQKTLNATTPADNGAPVGRYTSVITFVVNEDGTLTDLEIAKDGKYKTGEEALRLMKLSPAWQPAFFKGRPVKYKFRQEITFQVVNY